MATLELMPTGNAKIVGEKKGCYLVEFDSGEVIHIPKGIIDKAKEEERELTNA